METTFKCDLCNYQSTVKCNYNKHLKTKMHKEKSQIQVQAHNEIYLLKSQVEVLQNKVNILEEQNKNIINMLNNYFNKNEVNNKIDDDDNDDIIIHEGEKVSIDDIITNSENEEKKIDKIIDDKTCDDDVVDEHNDENKDDEIQVDENKLWCEIDNELSNLLEISNDKKFNNIDKMTQKSHI